MVVFPRGATDDPRTGFQRLQQKSKGSTGYELSAPHGSLCLPAFLNRRFALLASGSSPIYLKAHHLPRQSSSEGQQDGGTWCFPNNE